MFCSPTKRAFSCSRTWGIEPRRAALPLRRQGDVPCVEPGTTESASHKGKAPLPSSFRLETGMSHTTKVHSIPASDLSRRLPAGAPRDERRGVGRAGRAVSQNPQRAPDGAGDQRATHLCQRHELGHAGHLPRPPDGLPVRLAAQPDARRPLQHRAGMGRPLPSGTNQVGPTVRWVLPRLDADRFSLVLEVEGRPEYRSEYLFLYRAAP